MFHYLYCGNTLASTVSMPALPTIRDGLPTLSFKLKKSQPHSSDPSWRHHWYAPGGEVWTSFSVLPDGYLLRFPSLVDFVISPSAKQITCHPTPGTPIETVRHLLLDQVLPRCLAHQGMLMLHASAVALEQGVVLFLGSTGEGKSTLAGYFHRIGDTAISDDCVRILDNPDAVKVVPSYGGLRLWQDARQYLFPESLDSSPVAHYSSKQRLHLHDTATPAIIEDTPQVYPIRAIIFLSSTGEASHKHPMNLKAMPRRIAFIEMMKNSFRLDNSDYDRLQGAMHMIASVLGRVTAYQLTLPHRFEALPQARQLILDALG